MADGELPKLNGAQRAALLLMALGENQAAEVLKHMSPKEVQMLGTTMREFNNVTQPQIAAVLDEFAQSVGNQSSLSIGADDYLRKVLNRALGKEKAGSILSRISMGANTKGLDTLKWMDPRMIAELIKKEHPQIIAIVMVYLDKEQAGAVLGLLPEDIRGDVVMRIANLDGIHPSALLELDSLLNTRFSGDFETKVANVGGTRVAAEILNSLKGKLGESVVSQLDEIDAEVSSKIQDQMFIFENLLDIDDRGMQTLLRDVSTDKLVLALKGSSVEMQDKVFKNMSKRAAEMLHDDLESRGPVKLSEVEEAQREILTTARKLADDGKIMLGGGGDDFV
ncbi:MAG: flagellar motor switch protein FliG [Gammaproteobacteria bacterium]|nr:flagellar motor switch protein FliG [Gammaproteobacteria bacterium]